MNFKTLLLGAALMLFSTANCNEVTDVSRQEKMIKEKERSLRIDDLLIAIPFCVDVAEYIKKQDSKIPLATLTTAIIGFCTIVYMEYSIKATLLEAENKVLSDQEIEEINKTIYRKVMAARIGMATLTIATCVLAVHALTPIIKDLRAYLFPTAEEIAIQEAAREERNIRKAKHELRTCLIKNGKLLRNELGFPTACETLVQEFAMAAGRAQLTEIKENFIEAYGK